MPEMSPDVSDFKSPFTVSVYIVDQWTPVDGGHDFVDSIRMASTFADSYGEDNVVVTDSDESYIC